MKLSARNLLKGTIVEVKKGQTTAHVRIDIGGTVVTASITNDLVDELKLQKGQQAYAVDQSVRCHGWHRLTSAPGRNITEVAGDMNSSRRPGRDHRMPCVRRILTLRAG